MWFPSSRTLGIMAMLMMSLTRAAAQDPVDICTICTCLPELEDESSVAVTCESISGLADTIASAIYPVSTTSLRLSKVELAAIPTDVLLQTPQLKHLDLTVNRFAMIPTDAFASVKATLSTLLLYSNSVLSTVQPGAFAGLAALEVLEIGNLAGSNVRLSGLPDGVFDDLTSLKKLNLDRLRRLGESHFSGAINVFANLGALEELTMNQMVIRAGFDMGADFFAGLTSLKKLSLQSNRMVADNFGEDSLKPLKSLEVLELQANNIDKFPTSSTGLANLKSVQEIRFDSCPLLGAVPRSLPSSVTTLSFSLCRSLVKFVGDAAKPLKNLRVLDLSLTKLTSLPEDVSQLAQLEVLDLQDTALTALPSMAALTSLRELVLHGVDLQDAGFVEDVSPTTEILQLNKVPVNLTSMREVPLSALRTLNLNFMADEPESNTFPSDFLKNMPALTYLSFANAQFSSPRPLPSGVFGGQGGCGSLTFLSLQESGFNAIADGAFAGCSNLDHLDFRDNSITAITAATFVGLTNLRYLNLDNNDISSIEEGAWRHLTQLEQLQLSGNGLTVLPGFDSSVAYALKLIRLNDNDLTQFPDSILTQSSGLSHVEVQNNQLSFFPWKLVQRPFRQFSIKGNNISEVPALHNLLETAIDSTFDISDNALTVLPESFLQFIGRWGLVDVSNNQIEVISRSALGRHIAFPWKSNAGVRGGTGGDPMQLRMAGNPSVCKYEGNSDFQDRFDRFTLACECADSDRVTAASTYCASKEDIPCPVGQYQRDGEDGSRECVSCAGVVDPVTSAAFDCEATISCLPGSVDHDDNIATACLPCNPAPGRHIPAGSTGSCDNPVFLCPPGTVDEDGDSATPCRNTCDLCDCDSVPGTVDCTRRGLIGFPRFGRTEPLDLLNLEDNLIRELPGVDVFPLSIKKIELSDNFISVINADTAQLLVQRQVTLNLLGGNPTTCVFNPANAPQTRACFCASGLENNDGNSCVSPSAIAPLICPAGWTLIDQEFSSTEYASCVRCTVPGIYIPQGTRGPCGRPQNRCPAGFSDHDLESATPCQKCPGGTHIPQPGTFGPCEDFNCETGTTNVNADPLEACTICEEPGVFVPAGSAGNCSTFACPLGWTDHDFFSATPCVPCPEGHYVPIGSSGACSAFRCKAGEVGSQGGAGELCIALAAGSFSEAGQALSDQTSTADFLCPAGTVDHDSNSSTPCLDCGDAALEGYIAPGSYGACDQSASGFAACPDGQVDHDNSLSTPCQEPVPSGSRWIGLGVGLAALLIIIILCILLARRYRVYVEEHKPHEFEEELDAVEGETKKKPREIKRPRLKLLSQLGSGAFGTVMKGLLDENTELGVPSYLVAVKVFEEPTAKERDEIFMEAAVMAQIVHEHIVSLIGVVTTGLPVMIALQFCEHGSLEIFLRKTGNQLLLNAKMQVAHDVASGMAYLEEKHFVHRDLAARNVLISSDLRGKISDFGHARGMDEDEFYTSKGGMIAVRWTAPEALAKKKFSSASDVWSFGIVMHEIFTNGGTPYKGMTNETVWLRVTGPSNYRLPRDNDCPRHIYQVMRECWSKDRTHRPKFKDLLEFFVGLLNGDVTALQRDYDHMHTSTGRNQSSSTSSSEGNYPSTSRDSGYDATPSDSSGGSVVWRSESGKIATTISATSSLGWKPPSNSSTSPRVERRPTSGDGSQGDSAAPPDDNYTDFGAATLTEAPEQLFIPEPAARKHHSKHKSHSGNEDKAGTTGSFHWPDEKDESSSGSSSGSSSSSSGSESDPEEGDNQSGPGRVSFSEADFSAYTPMNQLPGMDSKGSTFYSMMPQLEQPEEVEILDDSKSKRESIRRLSQDQGTGEVQLDSGEMEEIHLHKEDSHVTLPLPDPNVNPQSLPPEQRSGSGKGSGHRHHHRSHPGSKSSEHRRATADGDAGAGHGSASVSRQGSLESPYTPLSAQPGNKFALYKCDMSGIAEGEEPAGVEVAKPARQDGTVVPMDNSSVEHVDETPLEALPKHNVHREDSSGPAFDNKGYVTLDVGQGGEDNQADVRLQGFHSVSCV